MPAPNKRFGVMRGICSRKVLREFESLSPVRTFAFPRPNAFYGKNQIFQNKLRCKFFGVHICRSSVNDGKHAPEQFGSYVV